MGIKYLQALSAIPALARAPFDTTAIVQFVDALADWEVKKAIYRRMLRGKPPELIDHLREITFQPVDVDALARLPPRSFGFQYTAFLRRSQLSQTGQVDAYPDIVKVFERDWMTARLIKTHDMVHTLLGMGADAQGEMGVQIFNFRNFHEPYGGFAFFGFPFAVLRYGRPVIMAWQMSEGWRLGARAENLFFVPLEDLFGEDIEDVRAWVGLTPRRAGAARRRAAPPTTPNAAPSSSP